MKYMRIEIALRDLVGEGIGGRFQGVAGIFESILTKNSSPEEKATQIADAIRKYGLGEGLGSKNQEEGES